MEQIHLNEQIELIKDSNALINTILDIELVKAGLSLQNYKKWLDFHGDFSTFGSFFQTIFCDGSILSMVGVNDPSKSALSADVINTLTTSAYSRFIMSLKAHNYDAIRLLANDPQFAKMLHDGRDTNYDNIMFLITDHLQSYLKLLNDIYDLTEKIHNHCTNYGSNDDSESSDELDFDSYFISLVKKVGQLNTMMNGDDINKNVIVRFGAFSFFHGVARPEDPPFVRLVRFFTKWF